MPMPQLCRHTMGHNSGCSSKYKLCWSNHLLERDVCACVRCMCNVCDMHVIYNMHLSNLSLYETTSSSSHSFSQAFSEAFFSLAIVLPPLVHFLNETLCVVGEKEKFGGKGTVCKNVPSTGVWGHAPLGNF